MAEFGALELIAAEFTRAHPARRASRRLLGIGLAVGSCWASALVTGRAWAWPVPPAAGIVAGLALITVIVLLAVAARSTRYRSVGRAGTAVLDASVITGALVADPRSGGRRSSPSPPARSGRLSARGCCDQPWPGDSGHRGRRIEAPSGSGDTFLASTPIRLVRKEDARKYT